MNLTLFSLKIYFAVGVCPRVRAKSFTAPVKR